MARTFVMGDPQAPFAKTLEVLATHGALDGDRLAPDVVLVSIGDHFDYDLHDPVTAGAEGLRTLRWLASHEPRQTLLLLGNHDASRVMELATISDSEFEAARMLARGIDATEKAEGKNAAAERVLREFEPQFPSLPPPGVIGRDYASFSSEQRALVMELLLSGRFQLALTGALTDGRPVLITHAGVTSRELAILGIADPVPASVAPALEAHLAAAIDRVRDDWQRGELAPMSLAPLHVTGSPGEEGGGLLYHRPSNPQRHDADPAWALAPTRPRRFDPRTLPVGLTQIAGHSGHAKCVEELGSWVAPAARARQHGGIRTLRVAPTGVTYDLGIAPPEQQVADLILIDGELRRVPATEVALLPLAHVSRVAGRTLAP
jgi:Calcineurin-like phosphoesterase